MDFRIGHGYDVHALADSLPLVLGGVEIAHTKGCVAHSDGDVAIHAHKKTMHITFADLYDSCAFNGAALQQQ